MRKHLCIINDLVEQIEENVAEELNIISLAKSSNMSPWHFQRLFKSLIGDSLGGYVRGRRLTIAAKMLLDTELRIIDIAFSVGFKSHEAFARAFKNYFNKTPKQFKENRPEIILNNKPLLTAELCNYMNEGITLEPEIIKLPSQNILCFETSIPSPFLTDAKICETVSTVWLKIFEIQESIEFRTPDEYYGVTLSKSGNFTEDEFQYYAGIPVPASFQALDGMTIQNLPEREVAVFKCLSDISSDDVKKTVDYIYGYWLPNSGYKRVPGNDYGHYRGKIDFENPNALKESYVIPITKS